MSFGNEREFIDYLQGKEIDLTEWDYLFTFGYTLDIYAYGSLRVGVDRKTGKKVISYVV